MEGELLQPSSPPRCDSHLALHKQPVLGSVAFFTKEPPCWQPHVLPATGNVLRHKSDSWLTAVAGPEWKRTFEAAEQWCVCRHEEGWQVMGTPTSWRSPEPRGTAASRQPATACSPQHNLWTSCVMIGLGKPFPKSLLQTKLLRCGKQLSLSQTKFPPLGNLQSYTRVYRHI